MPVYLVRLMSLGEELKRVETSSIKTARAAYKSWWPPERWSAAPSLRVDGKRLSWEREMHLMRVDGRTGPMPERDRPKAKTKPTPRPEPVKRARGRVRQEPAARIGMVGHRRVEIHMNAAATEMLGGTKKVRIDVFWTDKIVRVIGTELGLSVFPRNGNGACISATKALNGLDSLIGRKFPVRQIDGGIEFCWE